MNLFVVFALLFVGVMSSPAPSSILLEPGEVTLDTYEEFLQQMKSEARIEGNQRVAAGTVALTGEYPDFCYLSITFYQKQQVCGCFIYNEKFVVTSARCIKDCTEGDASNVTVTIPSAPTASAVQTIERIIYPNGTNGMSYLVAYADDGKDDFRVIKESNIALVKLTNTLVLDGTGKTFNKAKITSEPNITLWQQSHKSADGWKLRACGIGVINNQGERAKGVTCTEVTIADVCKEHELSAAVTVPTGQICLLWPGKQNNVCVGDFGGPVYAYKTDAKGVIDKTSQETVCSIVASPNVRSNSQCLDGHITFCTFLPGIPASTGTAGWLNAIASSFP